MSLAVDAVILFTAIFIMWLGAKRGFVRSVMGLLTTVASLFVAYAYTPVLSAYLKTNFLLSKISDGINETLRSLSFDVNTDLYNLDRLAEDLPAPFISILERYGISVNSFAEKLRGLTGCGEDTVYAFSEQIADSTAGVISSAIAFLVIFAAAFIILSILTSLIDLVFKLPVLRSLNTSLGLILGAAEGVFVAFILAAALSTLVSALGAIDPAKFGSDIIENTRICKALMQPDWLDGIYALMK